MRFGLALQFFGWLLDWGDQTVWLGIGSLRWWSRVWWLGPVSSRLVCSARMLIPAPRGLLSSSRLAQASALGGPKAASKREREEINYTPYKIKTKANEQLKESKRAGASRSPEVRTCTVITSAPLCSSNHVTRWGVILQTRVHTEEGGILLTSFANSLPQKQLTFLRLW